jgi:hypothetical protein
VSAVCVDRQTLCEARHTLNGKAAEMQKVSRRLQARARPKCLNAFIGGHFEAKILENARLYWCLSIFLSGKSTACSEYPTIHAFHQPPPQVTN